MVAGPLPGQPECPVDGGYGARCAHRARGRGDVPAPQSAEWARDEHRRQECHVPENVTYRTRHEQCLEMLDLWGAQVPHGWVTGDDELGRHTGFRQALRERGERYVLGVPCTTIIRDLEAPLPAYHGRGGPPKGPGTR